MISLNNRRAATDARKRNPAHPTRRLNTHWRTRELFTSRVDVATRGRAGKNLLPPSLRESLFFRRDRSAKINIPAAEQLGQIAAAAASRYSPPLRVSRCAPRLEKEEKKPGAIIRVLGFVAIRERLRTSSCARAKSFKTAGVCDCRRVYTCARIGLNKPRSLW